MKLNTQNQKKTENRIIFLFGPTAVGKTDLLCSFFSRSCEVVNADSVQVYRTLDIGSAKADKETLRIIPHHLIDIRDPWETWNVSANRPAASCFPESSQDDHDAACGPVRAFRGPGRVRGLNQGRGTPVAIRR